MTKEKEMFEKLKGILEEKEKDIPLDTLKALQSDWIIPFKNSWHKDFFSTKDSFNLSL